MKLMVSDKKSEAVLKCVIVSLPAPSKRGAKGPKPSVSGRVQLLFTDFEVCGLITYLSNGLSYYTMSLSAPQQPSGF